MRCIFCICDQISLKMHRILCLWVSPWKRIKCIKTKSAKYFCFLPQLNISQIICLNVETWIKTILSDQTTSVVTPGEPGPIPSSTTRPMALEVSGSLCKKAEHLATTSDCKFLNPVSFVKSLFPETRPLYVFSGTGRRLAIDTPIKGSSEEKHIRGQRGGNK